jgi:hypothetical protein
MQHVRIRVLVATCHFDGGGDHCVQGLLVELDILSNGCNVTFETYSIFNSRKRKYRNTKTVLILIFLRDESFLSRKKSIKLLGYVLSTNQRAHKK